MLFNYKVPSPEYVKFQRIVMGWLAIAALFTEEIDLVLLFLILSFIGLLTGTQDSPVTYFYKSIKKLFSIDLVKITAHHIRYYQINKAVDLIDHLLRLIASSVALLLWYMHFPLAAWLLMAFLSVFMMLSAYFGFCLSALSYIALQRLRGGTAGGDTKREAVNLNCILAHHGFTPYKRCDSCHVNINGCLGTKFNVLVLFIGMAMSFFLFITSHPLIELNIIVIIGLIFWLGYQVNYKTDELANSDEINLKLNAQLRASNQALEKKVQKRTAEIEHLISHDQLTNLYNRYWFDQKATEAIQAVKEDKARYVMAFLDLDRFKAVNDTAGHLAGDELLRQIALLMQKNISESDMLARLGGDEFGILCAGKTIEESRQICQKICREIDTFEFIWEKHRFTIGVSIGVVDITDKTADLTQLFHQADTACYAAKDAGRNRVLLYTDKD